MKGRIIGYNISESFNLVRWCLLVITVAFVAIVSVAKYIQLSDSTLITFSSLEITYLILNDPINIVYIYLPLYLFLISGIMFDDNFGSLEVIKCGSRSKWFVYKYITLLFYTLMFFVCIAGINFLISYKVFPYSNNWSSDFINVRVLMGQSAKDFVFSPAITIGMSLFSIFLIYLCSGTLSLLFSMGTNKESYALFSSLIFGLGISIFFMEIFEVTNQNNVQAFGVQTMIYFIVLSLIVSIAFVYANKKDFVLQKKL